MKKMIALVFVVAALVALPVSAQTPMTWQVQVFQAGVDPVAGLPFYTLDLSPNIVTCNATQTMPITPTAPPLNPKNLWWTQDELPGLVCHADLSGQTTFIAMPIGGPYPLALVATNELGTSTRGVGEVPFRRADPAHAPKTVRLIK